MDFKKHLPLIATGIVGLIAGFTLAKNKYKNGGYLKFGADGVSAANKHPEPFHHKDMLCAKAGVTAVLKADPMRDDKSDMIIHPKEVVGPYLGLHPQHPEYVKVKIWVGKKGEPGYGLKDRYVLSEQVEKCIGK